MKSRIALIVPALAAAFTISYAHAADFTWNGATDNWTTTNWNPGPVAGPTAGTDTATINSGVVTLSPSTIDSAITLGSGGTLTVDAAGGNITLNGNLSSSGALNKTGGNSLILSGDNSGFSGTVTGNQSNIFFTTDNSGSAQADWVLNAGSFSWLSTGNHTVQLGSLAGTGGILANNLGSGSGQLTFEIGAKGGNTTFSGQIIDTQWAAGTTAITKVGNGTLTLTNSNSFTGGTTVNAGTLSLTSNSGNSAIKGVLTVNAGGTVVSTGDGTGLGYNGGQSVTTLSINGGTVTSAGAMHIWSTMTGGVNMTGGTLQSNSGVSDPNGSQLEWGNVGLNTNASATTATIGGRIRIRGEQTGNVIFTVADGAAATDLLVSAAITDAVNAAGITKAGAGTMVLTANNTHTGGTTITGGTLALNASNSGFNTSQLLGTLSINSGGTLLLTNSPFGWGGGLTTMNINGGTVVNNGGLGAFGTVYNLTGGSITGTGRMDLGFYNSVGGAINSKASAITSTITNDQGIMLRPDSGQSSYTFDVEQGTTPSGMDLQLPLIAENGAASSVVKTGAGTLLLTGTNTYTGSTSVNSGKLVVNGSISTSITTVASGATLGGSGTVGALTISGDLAPGASGVDVNTLNAGTTTWNGGSNLWNFDLSAGAGSSDKLAIIGNFTKGTDTVFKFDFMGSAPNAWGNAYTLVTWTGASNFLASDFSFQNLGGSHNVNDNNFTISGNSLVFTAVPEPTSAALAGLLIFAGLLRRRRA